MCAIFLMDGLDVLTLLRMHHSYQGALGRWGAGALGRWGGIVFVGPASKRGLGLYVSTTVRADRE